MANVSQIIDSKLRVCGKTQREIAEALKYENPNIITMFKQGLTKVPIKKATMLARELNIDEPDFLKQVMNEYTPGTMAAVEQTFGPLPTKTEKVLIGIFRENGKKKIDINSSANHKILASAFKKLK